jgi:phosphoribosylamine--glycine ligase
MNILILGSGGREHALAWKISQSDLCKKLFIAPGNAGTNQCGKNVYLNINEFSSVKNFVIENKIDFVIVGPEEPLVNGIVDFFRTNEKLKNVLILGPSAKGAMLEGSKDYAKGFMQRNNIPTASYRTFKKNETEQAKSFLKTLQPPFVLKADGLAAGKGVLIPETFEEANENINEMLDLAKFGAAGEKIVIEEFLKGIELSVFVLTDGKTYVMLPEAKDYKRIGENDSGPNTGGMGAISPVSFADEEFMRKVEERIVRPSIDGLQKEQIDYRGFLFIGLMNVGGDPYVIEYNVRMGDPETEVVFPRIKSDVVEVLKNTAKGELNNSELIIDSNYAVTVMLVSKGYPGEYEKGKEISISGTNKESIIFHAGTIEKEGKVLTNGGRVMAITSYGKNIREALDNSYRQIEKINFEGMYFRKDIGNDLKTKNN